MKRLMHLTQCILADASVWCRTSSTRDLTTITRRVENEGISFLTISLPAFCGEFERALDSGACDHTSFPGFKKRGGTPQLLGGFLDLVFDRKTGLLLEQPDKAAIFFVRQICLLHKKIQLDCSEERLTGAFEKYVQVDNEVAAFDAALHASDLLRFEAVASKLFRNVFTHLDSVIYQWGHIPKHGPGSTADRLIGNNKYKLTTWHERLNGSFPPNLFLVPNENYVDELDRVDFVGPDAEIPVRVIAVPKTLKTPRIIAIEPTCMQYAQQALAEIIVCNLEKDRTLQGCIGFTDQVPNQELARVGSELTRRLATIDLSEASDRVSNRLVTAMFKNFPSLAEAVDACRSRTADVPGFGIRPITKFASMGSALCFPVEAMVFTCIIVLAYERKACRPLTTSELRSVCGTVRVYGDDIIVPVDIVHEVMCELESYGLKVNARKSFWTGKFRESCGKDFYDGHDVSVTYVRRCLPSSLRNVTEMISTVALRNHFYKSGCWESASYLDGVIGKLCQFPNVAETSPVLGRFTFLGYENQKLDPHLHTPLVKGMVVTTRYRRNTLNGPKALLKFFLKRGPSPIFDVKHLERSGRPESVDIKIRWATAL